jgi:RND family efflux transporter MFP subunit
MTTMPSRNSRWLSYLPLLLLPLTGGAAELATVEAEARSLPAVRVFDATVEAVNKATVTAETSGTVQAILFDVDDVVDAGEVLVRFRDEEPRARVEAARAELAEARARQAQAEQEYRRTSEVFERNLTARRNLDAAVAARDSAAARVAAAQARLDESEVQLERTVVRAPYSGIVTARHVEVGEAARPGTPLISGLSLEHLRVSGTVPQGVVPALRAAPRVEVRPDDQPPIAAGTLTLFPYADPATHTVTVRAELAAGSGAGLYPGMHVKLVVTVGETSRLVVPESALVRRGELSAVYVVATDGGIGLRQVRPGRLHDGWRVVLAGLAPGERVAVDPVAAGVALKNRAGR